MNDLRKAAGEALEALEDVPYMSNKDDYERLERVKTALRQALETKREWQGLTDEDIHDAFNFTEVVKQLSWDREPVRWCENFSAYIEAKLKEKNI